jgi:hypothetical protein
METSLFGYYGWDPLWGGGNYFGAYLSGMGRAFDPSPYRFDSNLLEGDRQESSNGNADPHLRNARLVEEYHVQATDGPIGHLENCLVDEATWGIRYLIIETRNWWPGQHVLISPYTVRGINWSDRDVTLDMTSDKIKRSPASNRAAMISKSYEEQLHGYHGWPGDS